MKMRIAVALWSALFCLLFGLSAKACEADKACGDLTYCMYRNLTPQNIWRQPLKDAANVGDLTGIVADTNACQAALGDAGGWATHSAQCDLVSIAKRAFNQRCDAFDPPPPPPPGPRPVYCYTQGKYYEIGKLGPPGAGICVDHGDGTCACGNSSGQIKNGSPVLLKLNKKHKLKHKLKHKRHKKITPR